MKVLVTGAADFIARGLLGALAARGGDVVAFGREVGPATPRGVQWLRGASSRPGALGFERLLLLTGIPISPREMWESVRRRGAGRGLGRVMLDPQPALQRVIDGVPVRHTL